MMFQLVIILKGINEVALIGQGALYVLARSKREGNVAYSILKTITAPIMKLTRLIAPRFVVDQHIGFLALFFLLLLEAILIILKIRLYLAAIAG